MSSTSSSQNSMSIRGIAGRGRGRGRGGRGGWVPKGSIVKKEVEPKDDVQMLSPKNIVKQELDIFHVPAPTQEDLKNFAKIKNFGGSDIVNDSDDDDIIRCELCGDKNHRTRHCTVFQVKPKSAESNLVCYYCKKPGHFKADCPKKSSQQKNSRQNDGKRTDFGSSKTSSFANRSQNRNFSENSGRVSNAGNGSQTGYGAPASNWSVVKDTKNNSSRADRVPAPVPATSKPSVMLRPQFNTSAEISGGTASSVMPSQPPKSKIDYNRSESEEYESDEQAEKKDDISEKNDDQEESSDSKHIPSNAVNIEIHDEVKDAQNEEKENSDEVKDCDGESKNVLDESGNGSIEEEIKETVEDEVKEADEDEDKEAAGDESKDVKAHSETKNEDISLEQKINNDGSANVRCVEFDSDSSPEEFGDPEDDDDGVYGQYGALLELSSEEGNGGKGVDENDEVDNENGDKDSS